LSTNSEPDKSDKLIGSNTSTRFHHCCKCGGVKNLTSFYRLAGWMLIFVSRWRGGREGTSCRN